MGKELLATSIFNALVDSPMAPELSFLGLQRPDGRYRVRTKSITRDFTKKTTMVVCYVGTTGLLLLLLLHALIAR